MTPRCNRCDWTATDDEPLAVHAIGSGHYLCDCGTSLTEHEPRTCERCITDARALLSGITTLYDELRVHLGRSTPVKRGCVARSGDEAPLPGGDRLVLLSKGSEGLSDDEMTVVDTDPPSIAYELGWWAMAWSEDRGEAKQLGTTPGRIVHNAAAYLEVHARWAGNTHPGFAQFHADLKRLHATLERANARDLPRDDTGTRCLDCREELVRLYDRRTGLALEHVTCTGCRREYTPSAYNLAQAATLQANAEWVPVATAAQWAGVSVDQVKKWITRQPNPVASCCPVEGGQKLVRWPDVQQRAQQLKEAS